MSKTRLPISEDDRDNNKFYNRTHFYGIEETKLEEVLEDDEDELDDDIMISENF